MLSNDIKIKKIFSKNMKEMDILAYTLYNYVLSSSIQWSLVLLLLGRLKRPGNALQI